MGFRSLIGSTCSKSLSPESVMQITNCCAPLSRPSKQIGKLCGTSAMLPTTTGIRTDPRYPAVPLLHEWELFHSNQNSLHFMRHAVENRRSRVACVGIKVRSEKGAVAVIPYFCSSGKLRRQTLWVTNDIHRLRVTDRAILPDRRNAMVWNASIEPDKRPI